MTRADEIAYGVLAQVFRAQRGLACRLCYRPMRSLRERTQLHDGVRWYRVHRGCVQRLAPREREHARVRVKAVRRSRDQRVEGVLYLCGR